jgi:hypothetical protein
MCSFTTIVGYGSLLLSVNQGIRSFGMAAILGEVTCITAALVLAPTLLQLLFRQRAEAFGAGEPFLASPATLGGDDPANQNRKRSGHSASG